MKHTLLILLALVCYSVQAQKWGKEFGINYTNAQPTGSMGNFIQQGHGAAAYFGLVTPDNRFALGADVHFAVYGSSTSIQEYTMDDGTEAPMEVIVTNAFANISAYAKWYPKIQGPLHPYFVGKVGYASYNTDLSIYDPDDFDQCEPVDSEILYQDGTMVAAIGAGARLDLSAIFKKLDEGKFFMDGSFNVAQGGSVRYMNSDANTLHMHNPPNSDDVTARFMNNNTKVVHEHHVGYVYTSAVQMVDLRFGFSMHLGR